MTNQSLSGTKRDRIIRAALTVLARSGYESATIKDIASEAGIAPGLVHYYFKSKEELVVEALRNESLRFRKSTDAAGERSSPDRVISEALDVVRRRLNEHPEWYRIRYALFAQALHNDRIANEMVHLIQAGRDAVKVNAGRFLSVDDAGMNAFAAVMIAAFDGLALQSLLDDRVDHDAAFRVLEDMIRSYAALRTHGVSSVPKRRQT